MIGKVFKIKKKILSFCFILCFITSNSFGISDKLIGTVGKKVITQLDLINEMKMLLIISGEKFSNEKQEEIQSVALKSITTTLIKKIEVERNNYNRFNKADLNNEIKNISSNLNITTNQLKDSFNSNGVSFSQLLDRIETELKWNGLIFDLYKNRISVNIDTINEQLELIKSKSFINEYLIYEIATGPVDEKTAKLLVDEIRNEIKSSGFKKAAIKYSKSESALKGGNLGWIKETMLHEKFKKVLDNTNVGSVTEPMFLSEGVIFLKLENKRKKSKDIDIKKTKNALLNAEKNKKLRIYSMSHFNKLKQSIAVEYRF